MGLKNTLYFIIFILFLNCKKHNDVIISDDNIILLKNKYSPEVINYFYETMFYSDGEKKVLKSLSKWNNEIKYIILGSPTESDKLEIKNILSSIDNDIKTVNLKPAKNLNDANFKVYIDKKVGLDNNFNLTENTNGMCVINSFHGEIKQVKIAIIQDRTNDKILRKRVLFEEIIQGLGVKGDSYSFPNSVFFEGKNYQQKLTPIDQKILSFLYDPLMPLGYKRTTFEKDFEEILYSINTSEKLKRLILKNKISKKTLAKIKKTCFIDGEFYKHPKNINIHLRGQYSKQDSITILNTISALNTISNNINLKFKKYSINTPDAGVFINLKNNNDQEYTVMTEISTVKGLTMFPKRIINDVYLNYKTTPESQNKRSKSIIETLYKCLGPINITNLEDLYTEYNGRIEFKTEYKDVLKTIYYNEFSDGYMIKDFNNLINQYSEK